MARVTIKRRKFQFSKMGQSGGVEVSARSGSNRSKFRAREWLQFLTLEIIETQKLGNFARIASRYNFSASGLTIGVKGTIGTDWRICRAYADARGLAPRNNGKYGLSSTGELFRLSAGRPREDSIEFSSEEFDGEESPAFEEFSSLISPTGGFEDSD